VEDRLKPAGGEGAGGVIGPRAPSRGDRLLLQGLLLLLALAATLSPIRSYDYWWHLRTGALILEQRAVPRADPFSFAASGAPWVDHEWLAQILLCAGHVLLGPELLVLLKSALVIALCLLMRRHLEREGHGPAGASVLLLLALAGASFRLDVRPELVTLILLPLALHLAIRARDADRPGPLAAVVALTAVGINLHVGVILVPVVLLGGWCGTILAALLRRDGGRRAPGRTARFTRRLALATFAAGLAAAVNPWGFAVYEVPFRLRRLLATLSLQNQEWIRPAPDQFPLFFAALVLAGVVLLAGVRHLDPVATPALLLCGVLAALHIRNVGLFFLVLPYGLARPARGLVEAVKATSLYRRSTGGERVRPGFIAAAALLASGPPLLLFLPPRPSFGLGMASDNEPAAAVDFLEREGIGRRLFNDVRFGGYLIWRRYPAEKVFIDGRNEIYGDLLRDIERALEDPDRWKALIDAHGIDAAFLRYPPTLQKVVYPGVAGGEPRTGERAFSSAYFPASEWALVYWDDDAMIFLRRASEHEAIIRRLEYRALNPDDWRYLWAGVLIHRIPVEPILQELQRKLAEDPGCARARELMKRFALLAVPAGAAPGVPASGG
jgi:hypothetical protein